MENVDITTSGSVDLVDGDWWPNSVKGGGEEEFSGGEDDDVENLLQNPYKAQSVIFGGSERFVVVAGKTQCNLSSHVSVSNNEKGDNTDIETKFFGDRKVVEALCLKKMECENGDDDEAAKWEKERKRKGKVSLHIHLTDVGPNVLLGPNKLLSTLIAIDQSQQILDDGNQNNSVQPRLEHVDNTRLGHNSTVLGRN
ncbi:hypothetical protein Lalb_Chr15g0076151 [Lupinus albus]|uniref:Uncharacterized protein n=1 Tax=Lupinus albus TaxID=3870 RepID=A0A6A4PAV4_LUPAL|nr:hypothetical protein Lalb_Chr15g0076151 [Lupinus albus]